MGTGALFMAVLNTSDNRFFYTETENQALKGEVYNIQEYYHIVACDIK